MFDKYDITMINRIKTTNFSRVLFVVIKLVKYGSFLGLAARLIGFLLASLCISVQNFKSIRQTGLELSSGNHGM